MNTNTGATYGLGEPVATYIDFAQTRGDQVNFAEAEHRAGRHLTPDERDAVAAVRSGDTVVAVAPRVAQAQQLGQRELERRRRRRQSAKQARKRNR